MSALVIDDWTFKRLVNGHIQDVQIRGQTFSLPDFFPSVSKLGQEISAQKKKLFFKIFAERNRSLSLSFKRPGANFTSQKIRVKFHLQPISFIEKILLYSKNLTWISSQIFGVA